MKTITTNVMLSEVDFEPVGPVIHVYALSLDKPDGKLWVVFYLPAAKTDSPLWA